MLVPAYGWRSVFLLGLVPAILAVFVRVSLQEPNVWKKQNMLASELKSKKAAGTLTLDESEEYNRISVSPLRKLFETKN